MKSLLVVVSAMVLSSAAFAIPAVGDYAKFNITGTINGAAVGGTLELSLTAYDQASDSYTEHVVNTDATGKATTTDQAVPSSNLLADATLNNLANLCAPNGGTLGSTTVAAGTFATCDLPVNNNGETGNIWVGAVPFGVVQQTLVAGANTETISLVTYTAGAATTAPAITK